VKDWFGLEIYNINNNLCVELEVDIAYIELEPARSLAVCLILVTKFGDIFKGNGVEALVCSIKQINYSSG
jgi:hypothetical protein